MSVGGGKVMVFDASSWSLTNTCHVGNARLVKGADTPVQPHTQQNKGTQRKSVGAAIIGIIISMKFVYCNYRVRIP